MEWKHVLYPFAYSVEVDPSARAEQQGKEDEADMTDPTPFVRSTAPNDDGNGNGRLVVGSRAAG
jgi:hypothetical protein